MNLYSKLEGLLSYDFNDYDPDELAHIEASLIMANYAYQTRSTRGIYIPELHVYSRGESPENLVGASAIKAYLFSEGRLSI